MVSTILIVVFAAFALVLSWKLLWSGLPGQNSGSQDARLHELNLQVFRNLIDGSDEPYLRLRLGPVRTRSIQRKRAILAFQMVRLIEDNARVLMYMAELAKGHGDSVLNARAEELGRLALRLRVNLLAVKVCLGISWLLPGAAPFVPAWDDTYRELAASLFRLRQHNSRVPINT